MKLALIGYGKMGRTIEKTALGRGHEIVAVIDLNNRADFGSPAFRSAAVAIEFSTPTAAVDNYLQCFDAGVPVVTGTTGWTERLDEVRRRCIDGGHTFFYASNFSLGVNIFFALNRYLAGMMNRFPDYAARITETHHIHKLDAPSGTAISLADDIVSRLDRLDRWALQPEANRPTDLPIEALREGEVPGIHEIVYTSAIDTIRIQHSAAGREGFASGAVMAAEFVAGKQGFFGMDDLMNFLLRND